MKEERSFIVAGIAAFREKHRLAWEDLTVGVAGDLLQALTDHKVLYATPLPDYALFLPRNRAEADSVVSEFAARGCRTFCDKMADLPGVLLWVCVFSLKVPVEGSFCLFMSGVLINLFAVTSLGIFLSCFARDMPQLGILLILVYLPMQMLSGGTTPRESMPQWVQNVMELAPTTHFVSFSQSILYRGAGLEVVWKPFLILLVIGAVLFTISLAKFRKSVA